MFGESRAVTNFSSSRSNRTFLYITQEKIEDDDMKFPKKQNTSTFPIKIWLFTVPDPLVYSGQTNFLQN